MSFLKQQQQNGNGDPRGSLFWKRAGIDGAPFRGATAPILKEEEFEEIVERVWDTKFGTFDTSNPSQLIMGRTLQEIMDGKMAGLYEILHRDHRWAKDDNDLPVMYQYIEWSEPHMELPDKYTNGSANGVQINAKSPPTSRGGSPPPIMQSGNS